VKRDCSFDLLAAPVASVLVVDDSRVQREHAAALCRAMGVGQVHLAENGAQALEQLAQLAQQQRLPEAMVIDLEMPVMDGVELIQQLCLRGIDIPFVVASTRETALLEAVEAMARVQGQRVTRGLCKPMTEAALAEALRSCARSEQRTASPPPAPAEAPIAAADLSAAIAAGRIIPHYQPKIDGRTGVIRGVEVLARWPDAALGSPAPDRFIAAAERCGQIHALTLSILDQAFAQAALWRSRGLQLSVAVNLSPLLLQSPALVDQIVGLVQQHGLAPAQVVLELTETSVVASQGAALGVLARLRMKGFGLSIDDYGTGFSSMQQLARVPCTELKIDRSFVDGAHRQAHLRAILQSAIEMATRLGIASVAEGVETLDDWRLLQGYGCTIGQGWLFGKAMPAAELQAWLKRHVRRLPLLRAPDSLGPA
jgi:EAL domain-containing protein (putative c-di-GMP-specific phosphodiesterase class I)/CheY-like chemotaxis protein